MEKAARKHTDTVGWNCEIQGLCPTAETIKNTILENEREKFRKIIAISKELHNVYKEEMGIEDPSKITRSYFVTISPKEEIEWTKFYNTIEKLIQRKCITKAIYSFEQRGKNENEIGKGFHVHIICTSTWRSISECIRDCASSCNNICTKNNIDVQKLWNTTQWDTKLKYIRDYESNDNHKIATKDTDDIWRKNMGINNLYYKGLDTPEESPSLSITSPGQIEIVEIS